MKGISLLDGILISGKTFEEFVLMKHYIMATDRSIVFNRWKNSLDEEKRIKIVNKELQ